jgi:Leucine-rich repeat (LRR) protein
LDLSDNALSGSIPAQLGDLISLRRLDLSNNFFENQLPTAIGRLQMLEELDISFNWCVKIALLSAIYLLQTTNRVLYSLGCPRQYQRNTEP